MGVQGGLAKTPARGTETLADEAAFVAAAQRDRQAFGLLYARYANPVYKYCFAQLGNRQAAEDATSLVFTKALDGLPRFHGGSFRAWLFTIARNVVTDQFRTRRFDAPIEAAAAVAAPGAALDDLAADADRDRGLWTLLAELTPDQRQVIELRLRGLAGPEVAVVLGRSHAWVKVTQFRAIKRLRAMMGVTVEPEEGIDGGA
jgi:RNA polymerase sigma-70 factor (ECF subfamily)